MVRRRIASEKMRKRDVRRLEAMAKMELV